MLKTKPNGQHKPSPWTHKGLTNFDLPTGGSPGAITSRGINRWRESQKLTVEAASSKYEIPRTAWYRIEKGEYGASVNRNVWKIIQAIGLSYLELVKLGTPE